MTRPIKPESVAKGFVRRMEGGRKAVEDYEKEKADAAAAEKARQKRLYESVGTQADVDERNRAREKIYDQREAAARKKMEEEDEDKKPVSNAKKSLQKMSGPKKPSKAAPKKSSEDLW